MVLTGEILSNVIANMKNWEFVIVYVYYTKMSKGKYPFKV